MSFNGTEMSFLICADVSIVSLRNYSVSQKKSTLGDLTFFSFFSQTVENF